MILIGQFDSPFVRRVALALTLWDLPFEHRPWSVFGDAERVRALSPLVRVPTLLLGDGIALVDSHLIVDHLEATVGPERSLWPRDPKERARALAAAGLAVGVADKAVALFYEQRQHAEPSERWVARCRSQVGGALGALEAARAARPGPCWSGEHPGHVDLAAGAAMQFVREAHPDLVPPGQHPALEAWSAHLESQPAFRAVRQPFLPPT